MGFAKYLWTAVLLALLGCGLTQEDRRSPAQPPAAGDEFKLATAATPDDASLPDADCPAEGDPSGFALDGGLGLGLLDCLAGVVPGIGSDLYSYLKDCAVAPDPRACFVKAVEDYCKRYPSKCSALGGAMKIVGLLDAAACFGKWLAEATEALRVHSGGICYEKTCKECIMLTPFTGHGCRGDKSCINRFCGAQCRGNTIGFGNYEESRCETPVGRDSCCVDCMNACMTSNLQKCGG